MEITGKITYISNIVEIGEKKLKKQYIIVEEVDEQYPNVLSIDFIGDKTSLIDGYNEGNVVTVRYNTRVNEYKGKHFNGISGRAVNVVKDKSVFEEMDEDEDLPF